MDLLMAYKLQNNLQPCHLKVIKEENNEGYTTIYNDVNKTKKEGITILERDVTCTRCGQLHYWCNCNILKESTEIQTS